MLALYRRYRPQKFQEVIGQNHITQTLINSIKMGKMQHAYLFCGPKGTGKTSLARIIAKAVNCLNLDNLKKTGEPCLTCDNCQEIQKNSLDIIEVDAASNRGIDEIRALRDSSRFTPTKLKFKVFIIDEVHMLTKEAFNALLKTLEEPPSHILFILATTEPHKVLETIKSRCQKFDLKKISVKDLISNLKQVSAKENIVIDEQALKLISVNANGSSRDALSLLSSLTIFSGNKITYDQAKQILGITDQIILTKFTDYLINKDSSSAVKQINELTENGINLNQFSLDLIDYLRKVLLLQTDPNLSSLPDFTFSDEQIKKMQEQAKQIDAKLLFNFLDSLILRRQEINDTPFPQLPLELAILENLPNQNLRSSASSEEAELLRQPSPQKTVPLQQNIKPIPLTPNPMIKQSSIEIAKGFNLKISELQAKWPSLINEIKKANFSLGGILNAVKLIKIENSCLELACQFPFHKEILNEMKNKILLDDTLKKIFSQSVKTNFILFQDLPKEIQDDINKEKQEKQKQKTADLYNAAVSTFGENI